MLFNYPVGATPLNDYSGLIPKTILTQKDLNRAEAENIFQAQKKYLFGSIGSPKYWFNIPTLKTIHKAMFGNVWVWAGDFRKSVTSIGIEPYKISYHLGELCADVDAWVHNCDGLSILEQAARIHHRLVLIHPFENGNGRFSRLVADRYLLAFDCKHPDWPYLEDNNFIRSQYIASLKAADNGDYEPLLMIMKQFGAMEPKDV
jgi:Fic-DOC domain mobile mystery protein B